MTGDKAIRRLATGAVLFVAGIAAVVSFVHIQQVALLYGQSPTAALLLPFSIDGTVLAASLAMLRAARKGLDTPRMGRFMLVLAVGATLAANVAYGLPYGPVGALISGWPAIAFIGCAELAIGMARKLGPVTADPQAGLFDRLRDRLPRRSRKTTVTAPETSAQDTREAAPASAVVTAPAAAPERDRDRVRIAPRARSRSPRVTDEDAEREFQAELATGEVPSIRQIRRRTGAGHPRATAIREHLEQVAQERVAA